MIHFIKKKVDTNVTIFQQKKIVAYETVLLKVVIYVTTFIEKQSHIRLLFFFHLKKKGFYRFYLLLFSSFKLPLL
jgi:hypothetical protein